MPKTETQRVQRIFHEYGFSLRSQGKPWEDEGFTFNTFKVLKQPFSITTSERNGVVELALYHESQTDDSDPTPLLETYWIRTVVFILQNSYDYINLLQSK